MTREGSYLRTSAKKECMLLTGLNFALSRGGGKYTQIVNVCDLSTMSFCTGAALSCLDLFALVTVLNDLSAASASAMVVSAVSVIDLREGT